MMGLARWPLSRMAGLEFWKLCGSGTGEGFTPRPNAAVWAVLCVWSDLQTARDKLRTSQPFLWYQKTACEHWTVVLRPISSRGAWSGRNPFKVENPNASGPVTAALTRATIKPGILMRFWGRVPDISKMIGSNPDVLMKVGLGEVPFLHQITFSIWPDTGSMAAFARHPGPHSEAVKAVREGNWFSEELYARFDVLNEAGHWEGKHPVVLREGQDNT